MLLAWYFQYLLISFGKFSHWFEILCSKSLFLLYLCFFRSKRHINNDSVISSESIKFTGELCRKGILSWSKCYCVLTEHALVCYRAGNYSKILAKILLGGCQTSFLEKEGKYSNLIRIARPGSEHWFYADSKDGAEKWITVRFIIFAREKYICYMNVVLI